MAKSKKTNAIRLLEQHSIPYKEHHYFGNDVANGIEVAKKMGNNPDQQFKTLVTQGKSKTYYVFIIPVNTELDLKKAAQAVDEKSIAMIREKELLPLTGYVHGGCSPIAMKKSFKTILHASASKFDTIIFSAGKVGLSVELDPKQLSSLIDVTLSDVVKA